MPNRFQIAQYKLAYDFIANRDGEYCLLCFIEKGIKRGPPVIKLQIDHANNNTADWSYHNLHLLCQTHNLDMRKKTTAEHKRIIDEYSAELARYLSDRDLIISELERQHQDAGQLKVFEAELARVERQVKAAPPRLPS